MTHPDAPDPRPPSAGRGRAGRHARGLLAVLVALIVGVVVGGAIVAVYSGSNEVAVPATSVSGSAGSSTAPGTTASATSPTGGADVQLSAACVRAVNDAQDAYTAIGGLDAAVQKLDLTKVDGIIRQVQVIQRRLKVDVPACHAGIQLPSDSVRPTPTATVTTG